MTAPSPRPAAPEVTHACPEGTSGVTGCCGRTPFELPRTDRLATNPAWVTCRPAAPDTTGGELRKDIAKAVAIETDEENWTTFDVADAVLALPALRDLLAERDTLAAKVQARLPEHLRGDGPCARCGTVDHPVWFTDNVFWNAVVRSKPLPWTEGDGLMCLNCFVLLADERGYHPTGWRLVPDWHWETHPERDARTRRALDGTAR